MNIFIAVFAGLTGSMLALTVKKFGDEYAALIAVSTSVIIFLIVLPYISQVVDSALEILNIKDFGSENFKVLLKGIGIAYITQFAADICDGAGETGIAKKIELAGKVGILLITLPVIGDMFELIRNILQNIG